LPLKVGVPFSSTVSFLKHSINARITDPCVLSLFDALRNNHRRAAASVPLPTPARRNILSLLASLDWCDQRRGDGWTGSNHLIRPAGDKADPLDLADEKAEEPSLVSIPSHVSLPMQLVPSRTHVHPRESASSF
jgi:hypothetical protein